MAGSNAKPAQTRDASHQKRAKVNTARHIPSQPAELALQDGQLNLQAFVAAHDFEIRSLEQSMATSKSVGTSRAFQKVPRGLRRRTASHNPKRVPRRLRARARREMAEDNTPTVEARKRRPRTARARLRAEIARKMLIMAKRKRRKRLKRREDAAKDSAEPITIRPPRPKIRRNALNDPPKPASRFRKRQINKTWLPTHKWHTKRARMTEPKYPLWRFAIPLTPNEKIYRPTHRAQGDRGALVWDTSYMSTVGVYGNSSGMERVLRRIGVTQSSCWNDKGKQWRSGSRAWTGTFRKGEKEICPATIFWNPQAQALDAKRQLEVWVRVHPAAFLEVFQELLRLTRMETPKLYIEDLRFEIGSIELTGPASTEALSAILAPGEESQHAKIFGCLKDLTNPAALPENAILGFDAQDPRLRYPPRRPSLDDSEEAQYQLLELLTNWPQGSEPFLIFDRDARHKASLLPSQKSINRRRGDAAPGTFLKPTSVDPPIPIILLASRCGSSTQIQGNWTILMPWKCVLPFWHSLVRYPLASGGNPQFAGLQELRQISFERGRPWFPADHPGTNAGADWEMEQRKNRQWNYNRRPKSKRTIWSTIDLGVGRKGEVGNGLACDFEYLFGLSPEQQQPTNSTHENAMDVDKAPVTTSADDTEPLKRLCHLSKSAFERGLSSPQPASAVITVRISILGRGVVNSCARIYRLPRKSASVPHSTNAEVPATMPPGSRLPLDLRIQWLSQLDHPREKSLKCQAAKKIARTTPHEARKRLLAEQLTQPGTTDPTRRNQQDLGGHPLVPDEGDLVGFVTTGEFCLSRGRGMATGSIAADKVARDVQEDAKEGTLCIVRNAGENIGWLAQWEIL